MRLIDADALKEKIGNTAFLKLDDTEVVEQFIDSAPSIDIVRCQDCKYWVYNFNGCSRNPCTEPWYATDGCTYGERNNG